MAGLRGDEDFEVRYQCNDCTPSSGMHIFSANTSEQVTEAWLIKGSNGEFIAWYWDPACTVPVILGEDVRTEYCVMQSGKTLVFGLYGKTQMDIKLKMGAKNSLPSAKDRGTVYFAKDGDKNFGELYYDDENGNRVKVGGSNISEAIFYQSKDIDANPLGVKLNLSFEDGTILTTNEIPYADWNKPGLMSVAADINDVQFMPLGVKVFFPSIGIGVPEDSTGGDSLIAGYFGDSSITGWEDEPGKGVGLVGAESVGFMTFARDYFGIMNGSIGGVINSTQNYFQLTDSYFHTPSLGAESNYIPTAYIEELHSTSINAAQFKGAFAGDLEGTARDAISWTNAILLNGTEVKGGETGAITTAKWGAERNISISSTAGTTGTIIDGSNEDGYTLIIPATMTDFTSITSTNLLATNLGAAGTPIGIAHFKETYFHNPNNNNYKHKLTSNAGSATCELQLPNTSGLLLSKPNATASVGDVNSPVYVALNGEVTACTTIAVDHGGTGAAALTTGGLLYGNNTSAVGTVNPTTKGRILVANGSNAAPIYASPTLSFTTGTNNPKVKMVINDATYESASGIQSATASNPGIVSTGTQTFAGAKTFNGAVTFGAGITSTTGTFSGQINANADIKIAAKIKSHSSGTSYITLTDSRATVTSPTLHLNGTTLVLNSSNYGTSLPTTGLEEGRVFFLLT